MSKSVSSKKRYAYSQNRELSWLRFNQRVLEEASDDTNPPLERLKFVAIFASNLDEFFMVRVGSLFDIARLSSDEIDNKTGMTPEEQLSSIYQVVPGLIGLKKQIYKSVMASLAKRNIVDLTYDELSEPERRVANAFFTGNILPVLSPIIIGAHHPLPHLVNQWLYVAAMLRDKKGKKAIGLVPIPESLPAYLRLSDSELHFIRVENMIHHWAPDLFGDYVVKEACILSVTRNADISFDEEKFEDSDSDFRSRVVERLKMRDHLEVVRLEISQGVSEDFLARMMRLVGVEKNQVFLDTCPLNMDYVYKLPGELSADRAAALTYKPYEPRWPEDLNPDRSMIEQIQRRDQLLFYPFDQVNPFLNLLSEAAEHPDVVSIKITIYRLASSSKIAHILCRAAENGKEVIVMMELRARFDEANNVTWSKLLEDAGCQVVYGMEEFKCHSKICLITMRNKGKWQYITQIGTGNYNEKTNAMYTDLSVMTASRVIGEDGTAFFRNMLVNNLHGKYQTLLVAPNGMKSKLIDLIDAEIAKGSDGYICVKANAVTERDMIRKLREASQAGVEVQLIIRGICCILPGVPGYTDRLHVTSIVGRYLEHARIYCFGRGTLAKLYISSADFMTRNLNRRVEIACPVDDPILREQLIKILDCQLKDNVKASAMMANGHYSREKSDTQPDFNSQQYFMDMSFHQTGVRTPEKRSFFSRALHRLRRMMG